MDALNEVNNLLSDWNTDHINCKPAFMEYQNILTSAPEHSLEFVARPGVSYSLRAKHSAQDKRDLFVLVDVVDDDPDNRWLSVCFYADMITDPGELGDFVPDGLLGEDALCFNLDEDDPQMRQYIADRIKEAAKSAAA